MVNSQPYKNDDVQGIKRPSLESAWQKTSLPVPGRSRSCRVVGSLARPASSACSYASLSSHTALSSDDHSLHKWSLTIEPLKLELRRTKATVGGCSELVWKQLLDYTSIKRKKERQGQAGRTKQGEKASKCMLLGTLMRAFVPRSSPGFLLYEQLAAPMPRLGQSVPLQPCMGTELSRAYLLALLVSCVHCWLSQFSVTMVRCCFS